MRTFKATGTTASARALIIPTVAVVALLINTVLPYLGFAQASASCTFLLALFSVIALVTSRPVFSVSILYLLMLGLTAFIAGIGVESGGLLIETGVVGEPNGAFSRLFLFYVIFIACALAGFEQCFDRRMMRTPVVPRMTRSTASLSLGIALSLITIGAGVAAGLIDGFAFLNGINRYAVRNASAPGPGELLFRVFLNNELFVAIFLGTAATSTNKAIRWLSISFVIAVMVLTFLHGEQFMSMLHFCLSVLTPVIAIQVMNGKPVLRYLVAGAIAALVLGALSVFYAYRAQGFDVNETLSSRFLLQGQAWYVVDGDANLSSAPAAGGLPAFARFAGSLFSWSAPGFQDDTNLSGLRDLMISYGLPNVLNAYISDDVTFTMGQMAVPVFWFGLVGGAAFVAITGVLYGVLCALQIALLTRGGVILLWLIAKVFAYATFALQQGEYWSLFGARTLFYAITALLWWIYVDSREPRAKSKRMELS
jgi:hypothetical protein